MSYLVLNGLSKRYGDMVAVDSLSLSVEQGEFISLLGPSGCGKTTTLQMIAGFIEPTARGSSVFALSEKGASSTTARWLANQEHAADLIGGVNIKSHDAQLAGVLLDLSTTAQINDSMKLAKDVLGEIGGINKLHKGAVEQAGFAVLKAPDIPSILIETAFISNPEEEEKLTDDGYQDQMADAVLKGIKKYFAKNPPLAKNRLT